MGKQELINILRKVLKIVGWFCFTIFSILVVLILLIRLPSVQNKITKAAVSFLEDNIGTKVNLKRIYIGFPKKIILEGIYLEDQANDTLLYVESLSVNTDLWGLMKHRIQLNSVQIENATANVSREQKTGLFNFDYIINAFSDSTAEKEPSTEPWDFSIGAVELRKVNAVFQDDYDSNYVKAQLGEFKVDMDELDLTNSKFDISDLEIINSKATIYLSGTTRAPSDGALDSQETRPFDIDFDKIHLDSVNVNYAHKKSGQKLNLIVGDFTIEANKIDLPNQLIDLDEIELHNTLIGFYQSKIDTVKEKAPTVSKEKSQWHVMVESILLSGNSFQFENGETPDSVNRFDPNHLWVYDIYGEASDIELNGNKGRVTLAKVRLKDKSGFTLETLEGRINLDEEHLTIDNFLIATPDSKLSLQANSSFNSLSDAIASYKQSPVKLDIDDSYISLKDVLFFSPALLDSIPLTLEKNFKVKLDAHLEGTVENLSIREFSVQVLDSTRLTLDGIVTGLTDVNSASARLNIENIHTTESDIRSILPDTLIPSSIQLPKWIDVAGKLNGTMNTPDVNLKLTSDVGSINVTGKMSSQSEIARYTADVMTDKLNVGRILMQPDKIGLLNMTAHVDGEGLSMDVLNVDGQVVIDRFGYNDYVYEDFALNGSFKDYFFTGEASLKDENLDFVLKGDMDYQSEVPVYKLKFDLKNADFNALHLSKRSLKARATLDVNLASQDMKSINGNMDIRNVAIYNGESLYKVDSLLFASIDQEGESEISIRSDIVTGDFKGTFNVFTLPGVIKQQMNRYFSLQDTLIENFEKPQNFKFDISLKNTDLLTEILVPELEPFRPGKIHGEFDSEENLLKIDIGFADVAYSNISADSVSLMIDADKRALDYKVRLRNIRMSTLNVSVLQFGGEIANDSILTSLVILDSLSEEKYHLEALIESENKTFLFHFIPEEMLLNYDPWRVPDDNMLTLHKGGFTTHNLELLKDDEKLSIITSGDSTAIFRFTKFQLANLTKVVGGKVPAGGIMNGDVQIFTSEKGSINSELEISSLSIFDKVLGDMNFSVQKSHSQYKLGMGLIGDQMKLLVNGSYDASDKTYKADVNFAPLNLTLLESLSFGQLKNVKGLANGKLRLESQSGNPVLDGKITFSEASFLLSYVNNTFSLDNQTLEFNKSKLLFNKFELKDAENNKAVIDGNIVSESLTWFDLDLNINTNNFQLLNTVEGDNEMYYGKLKVNSKVKITGSSQEPKVDMSLKVSDDSDLTYIVPISEKNVMERKGIVRFVDRDAVKDAFLATIPDTDTIHSLYKGINLTANIELTDKSLLTIVIDPATGDKLSVNGNANLVLDINASGAMNLSGRYDLTKGTYNFSFYNLTKRDFAIERGSTIVWSGDPLNATMDIRALYELETSPLDLVYNQINSANQSELNRYSQRLPFMVYLMIKGRLLEPEISFSLDMPENKRSAFGGSIYAKLQDINSRESDLNKQVFSLLILKRFISDNPFESQATSTLNNTARQSVSRLLSDQLNRLSENVKGVQLNFDIKSYEDYSGEEVKGETKVQLGVTKNLFNDRLVVKLSGNVDVEGGQQQAFADYIGDIALEYKLTSDGRFRITGFRNSNYDMIDGELIETGAGLIYIKDYNTLRELLRSNAKE